MVYFTTSTASTRLLQDWSNNQDDIIQIIILLTTNCISFDDTVLEPYIADIYESSIIIDNIGKILLFRFIIDYHYLHDLNNYCHRVIINTIRCCSVTEEKVTIISEEY